MPERTLRDRVVEHESPETDVARGRALRKTTPRQFLARLVPAARNATEILVAQNETRLAERVPLPHRAGGIPAHPADQRGLSLGPR